MRQSRESNKQLPLIEPALIATEADCDSKTDVIRQAAALLQQAGRIRQSHELEHAIGLREATSSTGFGHGFAIPHCKSGTVRADSLVILKLQSPVDWGSIDHLPVQLVILMAVRDDAPPEAHLKILAQLARRVMDENFRERLASESDPAALCAFLKASLSH